MSFSVCHISSVHASGDPRIRLKEIQAVAEYYDRVYFVTGDLAAEKLDRDPESLKLVKVWPGRQQRVIRLAVTSPLCIFHALRLKADVYHIHDPELLLWAWVLKAFGASVVYDIHEDYVSSFSQKTYLPLILRKYLSRLVGWLERAFSNGFFKVAAEKYYVRRFPDSVPILNYPRLDDLLPVQAFDGLSDQVLYTGNITEDRGALNMARFNAYSKNFRIIAIGRCSSALYESLKYVSDPVIEEPIQIKGLGHFVEFSEIVESYAQGEWLAGVALFPDTQHYREKELTKFFEYMAVGLPIIASDFPVWKALIEDQGLGVCVNPGDPQSVEDALEWLRAHPEEARRMGDKGKELARSVYSWEGQGRKLISFYEDIRAGHQVQS